MTDATGKVYEHLEYFPFGETWVQESSNTQRTPYLFTAKELDEETGLYYFGARYYDPRTSVWQSADPVLGTYMNGAGNGGVFRPINLSLYTYSYHNPLRLVDPNGKWPTEEVHHLKTVDWGRDVGMSARDAEVVGAASAYIDAASSGRSWRPLVGDQSYHFNATTHGESDSREQHFGEHYQNAVALGIKAKSWSTNQGGFIGWFRNVVSGIYKNSSLRELGYALHPLQDQDAHADEFVEHAKILGVDFQYHRSPELGELFKSLGKNDGGDYSDKADDFRGLVPGSRGVERLQRTEQKTKDAIRNYMKETGYE